MITYILIYIEVKKKITEIRLKLFSKKETYIDDVAKYKKIHLK